MRTIKASLKINKNGRLFCTIHRSYKVIRPPTGNCKICWQLYFAQDKQTTLENLNKALKENRYTESF